jgi:hypothetical protein
MAELAVIMRGKDEQLLSRTEIPFRLSLPRISSSAVRKVHTYVPSMTPLRWQWVQADSAVASE